MKKKSQYPFTFDYCRSSPVITAAPYNFPTLIECKEGGGELYRRVSDFCLLRIRPEI